MTDPKVLTFDIETTPILAYVWGLKDQNIGLNQIKVDWRVMAFAAKWLNKTEVMYYDTRTNPKSDLAVLGKIWMLLNEADIVITQYGTGFDSPKLNARFIERGMRPPSPYKHLDTYQIASKVAKFTSNKLEYLTDKLCTKYKKLSHSKFPGMSLWTECLKGNSKAWDEMKRYNIHDVLSTEELYLKIKAWAPEKAPKPYNAINPGIRCGTCGVSERMQKYGMKVLKSGTFQRYQCQACGGQQLDSKISSRSY